MGLAGRLAILAAAVAVALVTALSALPGSAVTITTTSLAAWTDDQSGYSQTLAATGGTMPYTWSLDSGVLPTGLTLSAAGVISGTPTAAGTFNFTVRVTDSTLGTSLTATRPLSITINAAPVITTSSLPDGTAGTAYSQTLAASGGTAPLAWSISSGSLPPGLALNPGSGVISGTPTTAGTFAFTAMVTDAAGASDTQALSIDVAIAIAPTSLPGATSGKSYSKTLTASGGTGTLTWSVSSGSLPSGLALNAPTGATVVLSGTTSSTGTFNFTVSVADSGTGAGSRSYSLVVNSTPSITTTSLPAASVGTAYSTTLAATGGTAPLTWSVSSGTLPAGLSLNASTGVISGTPTIAVAPSVTFRVTDVNGAFASKTLTLTVAGALSIATSFLPEGIVGDFYATGLFATGGTSPITWSIQSGSLPAGLALTSAGIISGTPTTAGTSSFTVKVVDSKGASATKALSLKVSASGEGAGEPPAGSGTTVPGRPACTVCGTPMDDVLRGTSRNDVISGGGGDDVIYGLAGNDKLYGDAGNDKIYGAGGSDQLVGGLGKDGLRGDKGADRIVGGKGRDRLLGGVGADVLNAKDRWRDVVDGGAGRDRARVDRIDLVRRVERLFN